MKKLLSVFLSLALALMAAVPALADPETIDLASMSLDDLRALQQRVLAAMWATDDWQSVEVPVGAYEVGVEIPAGRWTVTARSGEYSLISIVSALNESRTARAKDGKFYATQPVSDKESMMYEAYPTDSYTFTLEAGMFVIIEYGALIFTPAAGAAFTFK